MNTLNHKPIPYNQESPSSLLLRATSKNGWHNPEALLRAYSKRFHVWESSIPPIFINTSKWFEVCKCLGIDTELAKANFYPEKIRKKESVIDFLGMDLPLRFIKSKSMKICVECLKENNYSPMIWDLKFINVCTKHKIELTKNCPKCQTPILLNRRGLHTCSCGGDLRKDKKVPASIISTRYVEDIITNRNTEVLVKLEEVYTVIEKTLSLIEKNISELKLLDLTVGLIKGKKSTQNFFDKLLIDEYIKGIHPRALLVKFLSNKNKELVKYANARLKMTTSKDIKQYSPPLKLNALVNLVEAASTLGVSSHIVRKLMNAKILTGKKERPLSPWYINLDEINDLLKSLSEENSIKSTESIHTVIARPDKHSITTLINGVLNGEVKSSGFDINKGILSTKVSTESLKNNKKKPMYMTLQQVASLCDVHYENIRFLVHNGKIKRVDNKLSRGNQIFIHIKDAKAFNEKYIFSGVAAKSCGANTTNFAEKLMASGIKPVSGPTIDIGLIYLFKRKCVNRLNLNQVKSIKSYATNTGRKKGRKKVDKRAYLTIQSAASSLGVTNQKIIYLIKNSYLTEYQTNTRQKHVTAQSLEKIIKILNDKRLISVKDAAVKVNETISSFRLHWIESGFCKVIDIGLNRYIRKTSVSRIMKFKEQYITSEEAGLLFNSHRSMIPNIEKAGKIKHAKIFMSKSIKIKFYRKKDIRKLALTSLNCQANA